MGATSQDHALLLSAPDAVEADLARELLAANGIPSLLHGQDRDVAQLGAGVHGRITRPDLLVPKAALARAREILKEAWDGAALTDEIALEATAPPEREARPRPSSWTTLVFAALVFVMCAFLLRAYFGGG